MPHMPPRPSAPPSTPSRGEAVVEHLELHHRRMPLRSPFVTAVRATNEIDVLIVELIDSDGRRGFGEAPTSWRVTGESPASVRPAVEGPLREAVIGCPVDEPGTTADALDHAVVRNSSARMAVDSALYDLAAQLDGKPLAAYLGGAPGPLQTDMTLAAITTDAALPGLVTRARRIRDDGFRTIKLKVGAGADDLATIRTVRAEIGPDIILRVDANQAWDATTAVRIITACEDAGLGLDFVEQPVAADDIEGLAFVTARSATAILADESVWTARQASEVLGRSAAHAVNVKLAKSGGIREALRTLDVVAAHGARAIVGCMMESQVGIGAAAAVASVIEARGLALPNGHDLDAGLWTRETPVDGGISYRGDLAVPGDRPGLGITGIRG